MKPLNGTDAEIAQVASTVFAQVLLAHESNDYGQLKALLSEPPAGQEGLTEKVFQDAIDAHLSALGPSVDRTYLGNLLKHECTLTVWRVRYPQAKLDLLWQLFLGQDEAGRTKVVGIFFS